MQPTKEKIKGIKYDLAFEIPSADFETKLTAELTEFAKTHKEKGFRAGKVPMDVIKSKYENHFSGDILNTLINDALIAYCKEKNINPATQPSVKIDSFVRGEALKFSVEFEIIPPIKDINFSKITVEKKVVKATNKEVDEAIKNIANSRHTSEPISTDRKTKKSDIVIINFEGFVDGVAFEGGKGENYPLELGSNSFIPGFEDQLVGQSKSAELDVKVSFPKDYGHEKLAGKPAVFKVKINEIKEKTVPEINDAFAVELKRKDMADLKVYVKELLEKNYETSSKSLMKDEVLDKLSAEKIELPESLVEQEMEYMLSAHSQRNPNEAKPKKKEDFKKDAESRVKLGLILADLGNKEKIQVSQEDIQQAVMAEAMKMPAQASQVFEYYSKNPQATEAIKAGIFEEKVLELILGKVKIKEKEVSADVLMKPKK